MGKCNHLFDHNGKCIKCESRDIGGIEDMPDLKPISRNEWRAKWDRCMACGQLAPPYNSGHGIRCEIHEIACGPARQAALQEPAAWLFLCPQCHRGPEGVHNYAVWPLARALAIKKKHDLEYYDRMAVNRLWGRADEAITEAEVDRWEDTV